MINFDTSKFFLGELCKRKHEFESTGQSLRYFHGKKPCVECRKVNHEKSKRKLDERRHEGFEFLPMCRCAKCKTARIKARRKYVNTPIPDGVPPFDTSNFHLSVLCRREHNYFGTNKTLRKVSLKNIGPCVECSIASNERAHAKNKEASRAGYRVYRKTDKGRLTKSVNEYKRRMQRIYGLSYSFQQKQERFNAFDNACAYCGSRDDLTLDHFLCLMKGGTDTLGNILPACRVCNSSKNNRDPEHWYSKQPFFSKSRWKKILLVLGKNEGCIGQLTFL